MIKVSIIVPVFNSQKYLEECLKSIRCQTLQDIEIICIDDGSTDASLSILEKIRLDDPRIIVVSQPNTGAAMARNKGIELAKGLYIAFMDSDDWYPDAHVLDKLYHAARNNSADICGGSLAEWQDGKIKPITSRNELYYFSRKGPLRFSDYQFDYGFSRFLYKSDFLRNRSLAFPSYGKYEDPPFFVAAMSSAASIYVIPDTVYVYRVGSHATNWDARLLTGLAHGLSDVIAISIANRYSILLSTIVNRIHSNYLSLFYKLLSDNDQELASSLIRLKGLIDNTELDEIEFASSVRDAIDNLIHYSQFLYSLESITVSVCDDSDAKSEPLVSVIIPVYNVEEYLPLCLHSVQTQSLNNIEIIMVDDGSTDDSIKLVSSQVEQDNRIRILTKPNGGLSSARNFGMRQATGKYILFLDSDDYLDHNTLELLYAEAETRRADQLFFGAIAVYDSYASLCNNPAYLTYYRYNGHYPSVASGQAFFALLSENKDFKPSACMQLLRRDFVVENDIHFMEGILHEDNLFTMECLICSKKTGLLDMPLYKRRVRDASIMTSRQTIKNAYGYYCAVAGIIFYLKDHRSISIDPVFYPAFKAQFIFYLDKALAIARSCDRLQRNAFMAGMPIEERVLFQLLVSNRINETGSPNKSAGASIARKSRLKQLCRKLLNRFKCRR